MLTQADVRDLIASRGASRSVNMLHPLEIHVERERVAALVRQSLQLLRDGGCPKNVTPEQREAYDLAVQQRVDFLGWLQSQDDLVYLAIYPANEDGLDELELGDIGDLPNEDDIDTEGERPF